MISLRSLRKTLYFLCGYFFYRKERKEKFANPPAGGQGTLRFSQEKTSLFKKL